MIRDDSHRIAGFFLDSDHVYYKRVILSDLGYSSVLRAPLSGGPAVELTSSDMQSAARGLAFFADRLYWTSDAAVHAFEL